MPSRATRHSAGCSPCVSPCLRAPPPASRNVRSDVSLHWSWRSHCVVMIPVWFEPCRFGYETIELCPAVPPGDGVELRGAARGQGPGNDRNESKHPPVAGSAGGRGVGKESGTEILRGRDRRRAGGKKDRRNTRQSGTQRECRAEDR